jgi:hypothetical protein
MRHEESTAAKERNMAGTNDQDPGAGMIPDKPGVIPPVGYGTLGVWPCRSIVRR